MQSRDKQILTMAGGAAALLCVRALLRRPTYDFQNKSVLITGGSRGLGLVLARKFAAEGARLSICARDREEIDRAVQSLREMGAEVIGVECDITSRDQVEELVRTVRSRFGQVDVLVNNAGVVQAGPMEVQTVADFEEAMGVHFWGPLFTTMAVKEEMMTRRSGRIVNIASLGGRISVPHMLPYCATKFALVGLSEGLRSAFARYNVAVTTVCPAPMRTGSPRNASFKGKHRSEYAWFILSASLPGSSISAETAADRIVAACRNGDADLVLSLPAQAAVIFHGLFPGATADLLGIVNELLPEPGGIGTASARGKESESPLSRSWLTSMTQNAAVANNETG